MSLDSSTAEVAAQEQTSSENMATGAVENTNAPSNAEDSKPEEKASKKEQASKSSTTSESKQATRVRNSNNASRRLGDKFAKRSRRVDDGRKREFPTIKHTLKVESTAMISLLQKNISVWAGAAAQHVPMMQLSNRDPETRKLIESFHAEVKKNADTFLSDINTEIDMLLENNADLKRRFESTEAGTAGEFSVSFMHAYFWGYISIIEDADKTCAKIERVGLCGVDMDQVDNYNREITRFVSNTFRVLDYISKMKRTNRRNNRKPFDVSQFNTILNNYRKQIDHESEEEVTN
ncbi:MULTISPECIES: hypothetical protein [Vibrio]|uniref:Uncharacterized protein n=2 Tax=Vibrio TaxID=662 RepID=A0AAU9QR81_9VIBR|nr:MULTISPECIES: hypothetical protein [Vibrio]CAH1589371.1 conserved hypothetical protein [Vibrio jasicida]MCZ2798926.1 hypothetical protein [Vibrio alginolyticus]PAW02339.1 hypothetical protein CKJ79_16895 [Vibrio coralliilyticus]POB47071.1 hypothetical protein CRN52_13415 [Vibrio vulnificus]CAH1599587.1 conserved hypothetical protein [Vibrio jasicida]